MKKILGIVLAFLLYNAVAFYLGWNVYEFISRQFGYDFKIIFYILWYIIAYSFLIGRLSHKLDFFTVIGYYWFAFLQYGLLIFPITNLLIWLVNEQYEWLVQWGIFCLFVFIFAWGIYNAYSPVVRHQKIQIVNKKRAGESMKVVLASDFHFGPVMGKGQLKKFVKISNQIQPDIVLLAGDLVDDFPFWYIKNNLKEEMKKLHSKNGVYGILGNHEYYGKKINETIYQMEQSNIKMLVDETIEIPGICVITGREDVTNRSRKTLEELKITSELPWYVMDHTPKDIEIPALLGADLQVSGHTHLGQMWPNQYITRKSFPLDYGYVKNKQLHAITTSGFGFWGPPLRTNSRAELWALDIEFINE